MKLEGMTQQEVSWFSQMTDREIVEILLKRYTTLLSWAVASALPFRDTQDLLWYQEAAEVLCDRLEELDGRDKHATQATLAAHRKRLFPQEPAK